MAVIVTEVELSSYPLQRSVIKGSDDTDTNEGKCSLAWSLDTSIRNLRWKALIPQYFVDISLSICGYFSVFLWAIGPLGLFKYLDWEIGVFPSCKRLVVTPQTTEHLSMLSCEPIARRITQVFRFFTPRGSNNPYLATLCTDISYLALFPTLVHPWRCRLILQRWVRMVNIYMTGCPSSCPAVYVPFLEFNFNPQDKCRPW